MSYPIPSPVVDKLLELLGQDDRFRALFCMNPRKALAEVGYDPAMDRAITAGPWDCFPVSRLATKEMIIATRDQLTAQLRNASFNPIGLGVSSRSTNSSLVNAGSELVTCQPK